MFYKNNWFTWYYNNIPYSIKPSPNAVWNIDIKKTITRPINDYKTELLLNTQAIKDKFGGPFDLMFSGGVDSEIVLRCHLELGIPINVITFRYENDYNIKDYTHAMRICNELNITPTVIDFNLKKFFENDAYDIWQTGFFAGAGRLPHMKMLEYLDNIPIMGDGFTSASDTMTYENNEWKFNISERHLGQSAYAKHINRPMISVWYEYSPELIVAFLNLAEVQNPKNTDFNITKYLLQKNIWPQVQIREKLVGFEHDLPLGQTKPQFMIDFNNTYIKNKVTQIRFSYTNLELQNLL
jgi:hypothetical protein